MVGAFSAGMGNAIISDNNPLEAFDYFRLRKLPSEVYPNDLHLQYWYLCGQLSGDGMVISQATIEINGGMATMTVAGVTGVGLVVGGVVALHGTIALGTATTYSIITAAQLGMLTRLLFEEANGNPQNGDGSDNVNDGVNSSEASGHYDGDYYHGKEGTATKSPAPENGQQSLDNSLLVKKKANGSQRVAVEGDHFVVLDEHRPGQFHGHQRSWSQLSRAQQNSLSKANLVNPKSGKIK